MRPYDVHGNMRAITATFAYCLWSFVSLSLGDFVLRSFGYAETRRA